MNNLDEANRISKEIKELKWFINHVNSYDDDSEQVHHHLKLVLKIETTKRVSIFGSRWFGYGHQEGEIKIPTSLAFKVREMARKHLKEKEADLKKLIN